MHVPFEMALQVYFAPSMLKITFANFAHQVSTPLAHPLGSSKAEQTLEIKIFPSISVASVLDRVLYSLKVPALQ